MRVLLRIVTERAICEQRGTGRESSPALHFPHPHLSQPAVVWPRNLPLSPQVLQILTASMESGRKEVFMLILNQNSNIVNEKEQKDFPQPKN